MHDERLAVLLAIIFHEYYRIVWVILLLSPDLHLLVIRILLDQFRLVLDRCLTWIRCRYLM